MAHEQHDDTAAESSDRYLVRADTEQLLGDDHTSAEQTTPESLRTLTSDSSTDREQDNSLTTEVSPTWRAHHQDFYASKWFRSIQIFIIFSVTVVALMIYLYASPIFDYDIFASDYAVISLPTFLGPIFVLCFLVVGGLFRSKVFR